MKKSSKRWLMISILGVLILIGILVYYFLTKSSQPSTMFIYEFTSDTSDQISKKMSIKQVEGLEYSIVPLEESIVSEPSPDWGIMIYFTEEHQDFLYFYESRSPGGIDPFIYGSKDLNYVEISGKELAWGIFGGRAIGSCQFTGSSGSYGIEFNLEESLWDDKREMIFDLIESAQISTSWESS